MLSKDPRRVKGQSLLLMECRSWAGGWLAIVHHSRPVLSKLECALGSLGRQVKTISGPKMLPRNLHFLQVLVDAEAGGLRPQTLEPWL